MGLFDIVNPKTPLKLRFARQGNADSVYLEIVSHPFNLDSFRTPDGRRIEYVHVYKSDLDKFAIRDGDIDYVCDVSNFRKMVESHDKDNQLRFKTYKEGFLDNFRLED